MTLREIFNAIQGYTNDRESSIKTMWETSRFQVMHLLSPHVKKGKTIKAADIVKFPWDEKIRKVDKKVIVNQIGRGKSVVSKWRKSIPKDV